MGSLGWNDESWQDNLQEENCPGYHSEKIPAIVEAAGKIGDPEKEFKVKVHSIFNAAPEHDFFLILAADGPFSLGRFIVEAMPIPSSFKVTAVQTLEETLEMAKAMAARG